MPIYMNIVRDPIERVISWFYYIRAPWYIIERKQAFPELPLPHPKWLKKVKSYSKSTLTQMTSSITNDVHEKIVYFLINSCRTLIVAFWKAIGSVNSYRV